MSKIGYIDYEEHQVPEKTKEVIPVFEFFLKLGNRQFGAVINKEITK